MFTQLDAASTIVVLAQDPLAEQDAREVLGRAGVSCRLRTSERYDAPAFSLLVTLIDVTGTRRPRAASCDSAG
jgi:hypothetical protein